jgi:hypothetical protein
MTSMVILWLLIVLLSFDFKIEARSKVDFIGRTDGSKKKEKNSALNTGLNSYNYLSCLKKENENIGR